MSGRDLGRLGAGNVVRRHARAKLDGERKRLHAAGIPTVVIQPGPEVIEVLGSDFMSDARADEIVSAAFLDTGEQLRAPMVRTLLAGLMDRTRREVLAPGPKRRSRRLRPGGRLRRRAG